MTTSVKFTVLHFVRTKKLKSGRVVVRNRKMLFNPKHSVEVVDGVTYIDVEFDNHLAVGKMRGILDPVTGNFRATVSDCKLLGYLVGRGFSLMGYNLKVNHTATGKKRMSWDKSIT